MGKGPGGTWISFGKRMDDLDSNIQDPNGINCRMFMCIYEFTHTHTHVYIYIYIYIFHQVDEFANVDLIKLRMQFEIQTKVLSRVLHCFVKQKGQIKVGDVQLPGIRLMTSMVCGGL